MYLGAIADDFTGATDLALVLSREGWRVVQTVGVPSGDMDLGDADAVVVALKTRTAPVGEAVEQSLAAARFLRDLGARQLFFKYCSTFDSTPKGNIGPVIDALLELTDSRGTIACPSFPENGRTVYMGRLFVGDAPLDESSMKDHPLTPMRDASLMRVLDPQTRHAVSLIARNSFPSTSDAFTQMLKAVEGVAIIDAIDDADLRRIGRAAANLPLITGGSGVARGLPANFPRPAGQSSVVSVAGVPGPGVILAGSCSVATRGQIEVAIDAGFPVYRLNPADIVHGQQRVEHALSFLLDASSGKIPLIYSSAAPEELQQKQKELEGFDVGAVVEDFIGRIAVAAQENGFRRFIVAGGETSGAVTTALNVSALRIGPEIDPGVPWTLASSPRGDVALALKSGNFGDGNFFIKAWSAFN